MAKHRAESARVRRRRDVVHGIRRAVVPSLGSAAAVATVAAVGVPAATPDVEPAALVIEGSSTNPTGEGITDFYGGLFTPSDPDDVVTVNFFTGPFGVYDALHSPPATDGDRDVVLSSGWGAANVSLLLSYLALTNSNDAALTEPLYILDNNVARPNGGFGTRYPIFGVIGVNPIPTPTSPGAQVIDVGYEYDINGNTPAYVLNVVSMANSLATYFDNRLNQNDVVLPVDEDGNLSTENCPACTPLADGEQRDVLIDGKPAVIKRVGDTTYISYRTQGLPLLQPLRVYGGDVGNQVADVVEPALTAVVNYGYPDNDALANPERYTPARLVPTAAETQRFLGEFGAGVQTGIDTLQESGADDTAVERGGVERSGAQQLRLARGLESDTAATENDAPLHRFTPLRDLGAAVHSWQQNSGSDESDSESGAEDSDSSDDSSSPDTSTPAADSQE